MPALEESAEHFHSVNKPTAKTRLTWLLTLTTVRMPIRSGESPNIGFTLTRSDITVVLWRRAFALVQSPAVHSQPLRSAVLLKSSVGRVENGFLGADFNTLR